MKNEQTPNFNITEATLEELVTELLILEDDHTPQAWLKRRIIRNVIAEKENPKEVPQWKLEMRKRDAQRSREMFEQRKKEGYLFRK